MDLNWFSHIETTLTGNIDLFFAHATNLIQEISPIFAICFGIYLLLWSFAFWANGTFVDMGIDFVKKCIVWSIIIGLAFNASNYKKYVADPVYTLGDEIASVITGSEFKSNALDQNRVKSDALLNQMGVKGDKAYSGLSQLGKYMIYYSCLVVTKIFVIIYLVFVFAYYMVAKICLLLSLIVGPFFIGCLLFQSTRQWGMNWINTIFSYNLSLLFYACLGLLQQKFFDTQIMNMFEFYSNGAGGKVATIANIVTLPCMMFLATVVFCFVATYIPQLSGALTGGNSATISNPLVNGAKIGIGAKFFARTNSLKGS